MFTVPIMSDRRRAHRQPRGRVEPAIRGTADGRADPLIWGVYALNRVNTRFHRSAPPLPCLPMPEPEAADEVQRWRAVQMARGRGRLLCTRSQLARLWGVTEAEVDQAIAEMVEGDLIEENGTLTSDSADGTTRVEPLWQLTQRMSAGLRDPEQ